MSSESRFGLPYSLAKHVYAGHGLDGLTDDGVQELCAIVADAEVRARRPMTSIDPDAVITACMTTLGDACTQWTHELVIDENLREVVALLLPADALHLQRTMAGRLERRWG